MEKLSLEISGRETSGKGPARRARREGKLPGVLYGMGKSQSVTVDSKPILKLLLEEGGRNRVITLTGQGGLNGKQAMIKDYQIDPLKRNLLHVDLLEIDPTRKIEVTVALNFVGRAVGVADGGVMNIIEREIAVKCFATSIPKHIDIDVSALKIGGSIHLDELTLPEGLEKASQINPTLVTVVPPTKEEEAAPALAEAAAPEVITAKAPAEGEAAAAPAADKGGDKKK
ncbi:50S ribosomal protein L25 [bacterium]|nr:50S ribosomal protein L25 [bacterium]